MASELLLMNEERERAFVLEEIDNTNETNHGFQKPRDEEFLANIDGIKEVCMAVLVAPTRISMTNLLKRFVRILRCYVDRGPADAAEAKVFVCQALFKFRNFHSMLLPENQGVCEYYEKMSDMVAILIDLEVLSNNSACSVTLTNRVLTFLHLFFDDQAEYILHTLLKLRCMTTTYSEIMNPILLKVLDDISRRPVCVDVYLPFFLVSRFWLENIKEDNMKTFVLSNANMILGDKMPANVLTFLKNEVASVQSDLSTKELMKCNFDMQKCCHQYLEQWKILNDDDAGDDLEDKPVSNEKSAEAVTDAKVMKNDANINSRLNNLNQSKSTFSDNAKFSRAKSKIRKSKVTNDEIVVVDLTDDIMEDVVEAKTIWTFSFDITLENSLEDSFKLIEKKYRKADKRCEESTTIDHEDTATSDAKSMSASVIDNGNCSDGTAIGDNNFSTEENDVISVTVTLEEKCTVSTVEGEIAEATLEDERLTTLEEIQTGSTFEESGTRSATEEIVSRAEEEIAVVTGVETAEFDQSSTVTHEDGVSELSKEQSDNMDGLLLLASVSQTASRISIEPANNKIKIKDYAELIARGPSAETKSSLSYGLNEPVMTSEVESTYPDAADKFNEIPNEVDMNDIKNFAAFGLETTNAILNGETVVLRPKFPHSNLYVINKAVDPKNDGDVEMNELTREEFEKNCLANCSNISKLCLSCQHICKSCGTSPLKTANSSRYISCATCTYEVATYCRQCTYYLPKQENDIAMENGYEEKPLEAAMRYMPLCEKTARDKVVYERDTYDRIIHGRDNYEMNSYEQIAENAIGHKSTMANAPKLDSLIKDSSTHENVNNLPLKKRLKFGGSLNMRNNETETSNEAKIRQCNTTNIRQHFTAPAAQTNNKSFVHRQPIVHKNHQTYLQPSSDLKLSNKLQISSNNVHTTHRPWVQHNDFKIPKSLHPSNHQIHESNWQQLKSTNNWNSAEAPPAAKLAKKKKKKSTSRSKKTNDSEVRSSARISKRNMPKIDYTYPEFIEEDIQSSNSAKRRKKNAR